MLALKSRPSLKKTTIEAEIRAQASNFNATKAELRVSYKSFRLGHRLVIHITNATESNQAVTPLTTFNQTCCIKKGQQLNEHLKFVQGKG
jgi:hypothetical protein